MAEYHLLIDGNNLAMRCIMATLRDDLKAGGVYTGGLFTALRKLSCLIRDTPCVSQMTVFFDAGTPAHRDLALPEYKAQRPSRQDVPDEDYQRAKQQMKLLQDILPHLGVRTISISGWEADDLLAEAVDIVLDEDEVPVIVSGDRDLWQCLEWGAEIQFLGGNEPYLTYDDFEAYGDRAKPEGLPLAMWTLLRAMTGDKSDNVQGVRGVGTKTGMKLIIEAVCDGVDLDTSEHNQAVRMSKWLKKHKTSKGLVSKIAQTVIDEPYLLTSNTTGISLRTRYHEEILKPALQQAWQDSRHKYDKAYVVDKFREWSFKSLINDKQFFQLYRRIEA